MNFFKFLNFPLKFNEIPVGLRFQLASVTINFTDNHDYRAVLYSMVTAAPAWKTVTAGAFLFRFSLQCEIVSPSRGTRCQPARTQQRL